jgi:hypothetical protein
MVTEREPALPMNAMMVGGKEEDRPHPSLLPQEKEPLFPHLVNLSALSLRWFRGQWANFFSEIFSRR